MKKTKNLILLFTILLTIFLIYPVNAKEIGLEDIVEVFNNSSSVKQYGNLLNVELLATIDEEKPDILKVTMTSEEESKTVSYQLKDNILSNTHLVDNQSITGALLADCIGQLHGYDDGELLNNFNMFADEIQEYTVENQGFEVNDKDSYVEIKIDITKKMPLIDESKFYLKPEEFDHIKSIIEDNEVGNQTGISGKLAYNVEIDDDEIRIYIGETDKLTESAYKSVLSALEVMFGSKAVEDFKEKYPSFDTGNLAFDGYTVETDYIIDAEQESIFANKEFVLLAIDKKYIQDAYLRTEYIGETIDRGNKNIVLDFTKDKSYKLGFFDSVTSSDAAFFFKYILEPVFIEANVELEDNTVYFNVVDGKVVVGDKDNSIFKIVIGEENFEILPTDEFATKTTVLANHENIKRTLYDVCDYYDHQHVRYENYNVAVTINYGVELEDVSYKFLDGENQKLDISKANKLEFRVDIEYETFVKEGKVYIDDELVDSTNYTLKKGSTIITFNDDYVKSLSPKEHNLKVMVNDGEVSTKFTISNNIKVVKTTSKNPQTGDNIMIYILISVLSIIGLLGTGIYLRKSKLFN